MISKWENWQLLRTKTDETADDPDWVATNDPEAGSIDFVDVDAITMPGVTADGRSLTGIECFVVGVSAARAVQDRSTMTVDIQFVEYVDRTSVGYGGAAGLEPVLIDSEVEEDVPLQAKVYFPLNGGQFTIRVTGDTNDAVDGLEIWWRAVSR